MRVPRALAAMVALSCCGWLLGQVGAGSLSIPLGSAQELDRWIQDTAPTIMAIALVRLAAMATCSYLGVVLGLTMLADLAGWRQLAASLRRATPAMLRHGASGGLKLGFAAGALLGPAAPVAATSRGVHDEPPPPGIAIMSKLDPGDERPAIATDGATATMIQLAPGDPLPPVPVTAPEPPAAPQPEPELPREPAAPAVGPDLEAPAPTSDDTWVVEGGDSFWSIAEEIVTSRSPGGPPADEEIARYWRQLIAANRDQLAAPDHPDLLLPGQTLVLPSPD